MPERVDGTDPHRPASLWLTVALIGLPYNSVDGLYLRQQGW